MIDFSRLSNSDLRCFKAKARRDARKAEGVCINGPAIGLPNQHGPVVARGGRCAACVDVYRRSK